MSRGGYGSSSDCRIYVGNLPPDIREKELDDLFYKYGNIKHIDLKNKRGSPFAFIDFDDSRDADDAVSGRNNYSFDGYRLRVEIPRSSSRYDGDKPRTSTYVRGKPGPPSKRTDFRVLIEGMPSSGSWQDLKDHMREAGDVCYADVFKDGTGVVEFGSKDDAEFAVKHLDDSKFRSHENETSYIKVRRDGNSSSSRSRRSRSRSRSRSRDRHHTSSRRRSPSYSPRRRSSRSRSRS